MKVIIWKKDRIEYILNGLCNYYGIGRDELIRRHKNPMKTNRKRIAVKLLTDVANCTLRDIAESMGRTSLTSISLLYHEISQDVSPVYYGNKDLKKEYSSILEYLGL